MVAQVELAKNQWVVVLRQHYCAHELRMPPRSNHRLGKVVLETRLAPGGIIVTAAVVWFPNGC